MKNLETDKGLCIVLVFTHSDDLFIMSYVCDLCNLILYLQVHAFDSLQLDHKF